MVDGDSGFAQVVTNRVNAIGWEQRVLPGPVSPEALVAMRLNALVVDLGWSGRAGGSTSSGSALDCPLWR
jgi:hypothetical protein